MNETQRVKVKVEIMGKEFRFISNPETPVEYIHKVAGFVDEHLRRVSEIQPTLDISRVSILASVNITDEYFKMQNERDQLARTLQEKQSMEDQLRAEIAQLKERNEKLEQKLEQETMQDQSWQDQYEKTMEHQQQLQERYSKLEEEYSKLQQEFNDWLDMMEEDNTKQ